MALQSLKQRIVARFEELVKEGEAILYGISVYTNDTLCKDVMGRVTGTIPHVTYSLDTRRYERWKTNCLVLFDNVIAESANLAESIQFFNSAHATKPHVEICLAIAEAFKDSYEHGLFDSINEQIQAEVSANYLDQARELLNEGTLGNHDHVPAAVLAGAVLERNLRGLCERQHPPLPVTNGNSEPLRLNSLIDDLKKAGVYNELKAKQLRAWADIRNRAAHGEFDQFNRSDVEQMLVGISNFLADYIR